MIVADPRDVPSITDDPFKGEFVRRNPTSAEIGDYRNSRQAVSIIRLATVFSTAGVREADAVNRKVSSIPPQILTPACQCLNQTLFVK